MILVGGVPKGAMPGGSFALIGRGLTLAGSLIGGVPQTQEMIDFCAQHDILCEIELVEAKPEAVDVAWYSLSLTHPSLAHTTLSRTHNPLSHTQPSLSHTQPSTGSDASRATSSSASSLTRQRRSSPLGPLGSSSSHHRWTLELVLQLDALGARRSCRADAAGQTQVPRECKVRCWRWLLGNKTQISLRGSNPALAALAPLAPSRGTCPFVTARALLRTSPLVKLDAGVAMFVFKKCRVFPLLDLSLSLSLSLSPSPSPLPPPLSLPPCSHTQQVLGPEVGYLAHKKTHPPRTLP